MDGHLEDVRKEMRALLKSQGLRATGARLAVMVALHERGAPMTHEEVMGALGAGAFDRATVWRILSDMSDSGFFRRMDLGDRVWRYELIDNCRSVEDDHAHFLCETCGTVSCLPPLEIRAKDGSLPAALHGAAVRLRVIGTCGDCLEAG
jgi:Fur family ferric uptake transcriptional regulator